MYKVYFDGSTFEDSQLLTLAGVIASDTDWASFDSKWLEYAAAFPRHTHLHMTDAMALKGQFADWEERMRDWAVGHYISLIENHMHALKAVTVTIDLSAHRRWSLVRPLPKADRICSRLTFGILFDYFYANSPPGEKLAVYYDRDEPFRKYTEAMWSNKEIRKRLPILNYVEMIAASNAQAAPALQVADVLAWGVNRTESHGDDSSRDPLGGIAIRAAGCLDSIRLYAGDSEFERGDFSETFLTDMDKQMLSQQKRSFDKRALIKGLSARTPTK